MKRRYTTYTRQSVCRKSRSNLYIAWNRVIALISVKQNLDEIRFVWKSSSEFGNAMWTSKVRQINTSFTQRSIAHNLMWKYALLKKAGWKHSVPDYRKIFYVSYSIWGQQTAFSKRLMRARLFPNLFCAFHHEKMSWCFLCYLTKNWNNILSPSKQ